MRGFIREERVTYPEYHAALRYLIRTAEAGEIALLVAAFAESTVDTVNADGGRATASAIEGPFYKPGAPWLQRPHTLPMRPDEPWAAAAATSRWPWPASPARTDWSPGGRTSTSPADPAGLEFDDERHIQPTQRHGSLDVEQVCGQQLGGAWD